MEKIKNRTERFLEFGGNKISILDINGTWWIAIKPICEALNVSYSGQFERIQRHRILAELFVQHEWLATDNKMRNMLCLPEKYIYGWLFSINSDSPELINYQKECYEVLYNHFHSMLAARYESLKKIEDNDSEIADLQKQLLLTPEYLKIQELEKDKKTASAKLKSLDKELKSGQTSIQF